MDQLICASLSHTRYYWYVGLIRLRVGTAARDFQYDNVSEVTNRLLFHGSMSRSGAILQSTYSVYQYIDILGAESNFLSILNLKVKWT